MVNYDVIVIGAGLAGTLSALELAKKYKILLIEAGSDIIPTTSSSFNECYKLHLGLHYIGDPKTAEQCLRKSIEFVRKFPAFIAGGSNLFSPYRRGRHYIMKNSMVSVDDAKAIAMYLKQIYTDLVQQDSRNKVFGEPEDFIHFLKRQDYKHIADSIPYYDKDGNISYTSVAAGIETAESQIDIDALKAHLQQEISKNSNITFMPLTKVNQLAYRNDQFGYIVSVQKQNGEKENLIATTVVNCAWQNIEKIDRTISPCIFDENRVNRIKVSILVELPKSLHHMNTCIFSSGPYCSVTILPNGQAILTSERITNIGFYNTSISSNIKKQFLSKLNLEHEEGQKLAQQILIDCASYMEEDTRQLFMQAQINSIRIGFVKLMNIQDQYNDISIYEKNSVIHARQPEGIEHKGLGHVSNSGMKMTYTAGNAEKVKRIIENDLKLIESLNNMITLAKKDLSIDVQTQYSKTIDLFSNAIYRDKILQLLSKELAPHEDYVKLITEEIKNYLHEKSNTLLITQNGFFTNTPIITNIPNERLRIVSNLE